MRIYKIIDHTKREAAIDLLNKVEKQKKENLEIIQKEVTPFPWTQYLGTTDSFSLLPRYLGFLPEKPLEETPKGFKYDKDYESILVFNKRTKEGKRLSKIVEDLKYYCIFDIYIALDIDEDFVGKFTIPKLMATKDKEQVFVFLDDRHKMPKEQYTEVTQTYLEEAFENQ